MTDKQRPDLVRLGDTDLTLAPGAEDIRGRKLLDKDGNEIGTIDALMLDQGEQKIRFLHVSAGGFLGIGDETLLIPVDAVTEIHDDHVHVDQTRDRIVEGPRYDPALVESPDYWEKSYQYYGIAPFWNINP